MTQSQDYLVSIELKTFAQAWITAESEDAALEEALRLYDDEVLDPFDLQRGPAASASVINTRPQSPTSFRISIRQPVVHTTDVAAPTEAQAVAIVLRRYLEDERFFTNPPPADWKRRFEDARVISAERITPSSGDGQ